MGTRQAASDRETDSYRSMKSIFDHQSHVPSFGEGHDISLSNYASSNLNSYSHLGYEYSPPRGYNYGSNFAQTFLAGTYQFTPDEIETFYETT